MSIVLALAVVAVVVCAAPRRRRRTPSKAAVTVRSLGKHTRAAVRGLLAILAAGAVLLLFGQQASAQADESPEPPPIVQPTPDGTDGPIGDVDAPPTNDPAGGSHEPGSPLVEPGGDGGAEDPGGVGAPDAPATEPPAVPTPPVPSPPSDVDITLPDSVTPPAPPTVDSTSAPPPPAAPPPLPAPPIDPPAVAVMAPREVDLGLWNVTLRGRAWVRSDGATISIGFDGDGTELVRATADVSEIVVTGSDGDDTLEVSDGIGVLVRYDGGGGVDALVMPASGGTARLTGSRTGEVFDRFGTLLLSFANVDDLIGGPGPDTFVADQAADLRSLDMGPEDRLIVDLGGGAGGAAAPLLSVESADLAGTLEVIGGPSSGLLDSAPVPFLSFGTAHGDFSTFRGLDLGGGAYVRPTTVAGGYELRAGQLPDEIVIRFPSAIDADEFFTFLSGKGNAFAAGTPVTIQLGDNELTGDLTVSGTPDSATLALANAKLHFGGSQDALLTLEDDAAVLTLTESNLSGTLDGSLTTTVRDVSFAGTFHVALNSDDRSIAAVGNGVTVTVAGSTFDDVDLVVTVVGEGADMALVITAPDGTAVTIPGTGPTADDVSALAAALQRDVGTSGLALSATGSAAARAGSATDSPIDPVTIAGSTESAAHISGSIVTNTTRRPLVGAGAAVLSAFHTLGPLLALAGVAGPLVVATSTGAASSSSSRRRTDVLGRRRRRRTGSLAPSSSNRVLVDEAFAPGESLTTAPARGPPGGGAPAIASEILVHLSPASPQRIPGAQGPFLVTTARRATAASVESGWVDRAPGVLLSLFVLLFLLFVLWTRGRRSTRPSGPCRRRARGFLHAKGDAGGVIGGHGVAGGADTGGAMHIAVRSDRFGRAGRCGLPRWRAAEAR